MTAARDSHDGAHAELPGVKLWFSDSGGDGAPVVLLHPNTGTVAIWEPQISAFAQAGYRVIAFDRRGWGKSVPDPAAGSQPGSIAGDLHALADYLKLDKFHLLGVAGGGFIALDYAAWHPERVRSLIVGASTGAIEEREVAEFIARIAIPEIRKQSAHYREIGASYRGANPEGTKRWIEIDEHARQPATAFQPPLRTPNTLAKIATIPAPTLIIAADADLLAPPALMRLWATHLKNHEWAIIPEAGHAMAWEQPGTFNDKVIDFLRRHDR
jgi:pimeloyl-ACP methyl ester carboxylesterase